MPAPAAGVIAEQARAGHSVRGTRGITSAGAEPGRWPGVSGPAITQRAMKCEMPGPA